MRWLLLSSFYRREDGSAERFSYLLKVTQLKSSSIGI